MKKFWIKNFRDIVPVRGNQKTIRVLKIININRMVNSSQEKYYGEANFKRYRSARLDHPQSGIIGKALKKTSTATGFWFLIFGFEYLKRLQKSGPLHTKMHLILLLVGITGCMGTYRDLFRRTVLQKCGRLNTCSWDYGLGVEYLKKTNNPRSKPKYE
jgi:hypothetical protein